MQNIDTEFLVTTARDFDSIVPYAENSYSVALTSFSRSVTRHWPLGKKLKHFAFCFFFFVCVFLFLIPLINEYWNKMGSL